MRHLRINLRVAALAAAVMLTAVTAAWAADKIRTRKGIGYRGEITGVAGNGLVLRDENAIRRAIPLDDIAEIEVEKFPDLARAEAAYARGMKGQAAAFKEAETLYVRLLRLDAPSWLRVLVQYRMYKLYGDSGRVPEALDAYLEMARSSPALVANMRLPDPSRVSPEVAREMLRKVDDALQAPASRPYAAQLQSFRVGLLTKGGKTEEAIAAAKSLSKRGDTRTRLAGMLKEMELLLASGKADEAAARLDDAAKLLVTDPAELAYWRGRVYEEQGRNLQAALEYMRLPILYPTQSRDRTADALWRAGKTLEAAKASPSEAVAVYREAVQKYAGTAGAERAKQELNRLGASAPRG